MQCSIKVLLLDDGITHNSNSITCWYYTHNGIRRSSVFILQSRGLSPVSLPAQYSPIWLCARALSVQMYRYQQKMYTLSAEQISLPGHLVVYKYTECCMYRYQQSTLSAVQIPTEDERFPLRRSLWKRCSALEHFDFLSISIMPQTDRAEKIQNSVNIFLLISSLVNYFHPCPLLSTIANLSTSVNFGHLITTTWPN